MRLYEYEGKALLAEHGLTVPRGALWPDLPDGAGPFVVKAQVLAGRRGKQGGIRMAPDRDACRREAEAILGSRIGDHLVERVWVEERLEIARELYLAVLVDRDRRAPLLLATARGGVDVEDVPEDELVRMPIDPLLGLRPFAVRHVVGWLGLSVDLADQIGGAIEELYHAFETSEAELVEVNPLVVTRDRRVVAADAKVVLDDQALFRHPERPRRDDEGTPFERRCAALGAVGVEMDGAIAAVVSGAGLMMATVDLLSAAGGRLRAAVDLGGTVLSESGQLGEVIRTVVGLRPEVVFLNAFFQLAYCDTLARSIVAGFEGQDWRGRVVIRLKGRNLPEARAILEPLGFTVVEELDEACRIAALVGKEDGGPRTGD